MDIPKSEKTDGTRSTQLRDHLTLIKVVFLWAWALWLFPCVYLLRTLTNNLGPLFQKLQINQSVAFQGKEYTKTFKMYYLKAY